MVEHDFVTQVLLKLSEKKASCETWVLLEMCGVESPLMLEERFQVLAEPFCEGCSESEEVAGLAGVESAVHIGIEKDAEMWWQCELIQSEYVVVVGGVWLAQEEVFGDASKRTEDRKGQGVCV